MKKRTAHNKNKKLLKGYGYVEKDFRKNIILGFLAIHLISATFAVYGLLNKDNNQLVNPVLAVEFTQVSIKEVEIEKKVEKSPKIAKITAYSCGNLKTEEEILMNCPSLFSGEPRTANGTKPIPYKTMACDVANMGKSFDIDGLGTITCTDIGGAIIGAGRFDIYLPTVEEAREWGVKHLSYTEVK